MLVPVMQVRQMRMGMGQRWMFMPVRVRLGPLVAAVRVLVVLVVDVTMIVSHIFVLVLVGMLLGQYEPRGGNHQCKRDAERNGEWFPERENCNRGADERRGTEMRGGARAAEMPQREDEQHEADAVTQESDYERPGKRRGCGNMQPERKRQGEIE